MVKKVIFIASTAYSGSTMFDLMLSNADQGFSCGEVYALFRPWRPHHTNPMCGCGDRNCRIWPELKKQGEQKLYDHLFTKFPNIAFIVDSSKDLDWFVDQKRYLLRYDCETINLLLWKDPLDYAFSRWKRGLLDGWRRTWVAYYAQCINLFDRWYSVPYKDLATNPSRTLDLICKKIGIDYFPGKELFWEHEQHYLFGSDSVKTHMQEVTSPDFSEMENKRRSEKINQPITEIKELTNHRSFYYDSCYEGKLPLSTIPLAQKDRNIIDMVEVFAKTSYECDHVKESILEAKNLFKKPKYSVSMYFWKDKIVKLLEKKQITK